MARLVNFSNELSDIISESKLFDPDNKITDPKYVKVKKKFLQEVLFIEHLARSIIIEFYSCKDDAHISPPELRKTNKNVFREILNKGMWRISNVSDRGAYLKVHDIVDQLYSEFVLHKFIGDTCGLPTTTVKEIVNIIDDFFIDFICHMTDKH